MPVEEDADEAAVDVHVYIDDGVHEGAPDCDVPAGQAQAGPHGNQKDDYLHRAEPGESSLLLGMGIYHYSECVSRVLLPPGKKPEDLQHPYYPFAKHYRVGTVYCQKWDFVRAVPRVPGGCGSHSK